MRLASKNPADTLGLSDRGEIATGKRADLTIVDVKDRVVQTFCAGEIIFANGAWPEAAEETTVSDLSERNTD